MLRIIFGPNEKRMVTNGGWKKLYIQELENLYILFS
jgi:hypothetical protein